MLPNTEALATMMREINDKLDTAMLKDVEPHAFEPMLTEIIDKLDRISRFDASSSLVDVGSIEQALQSLHAKLDLGDGRTFDRQIVGEIAEEVARRLDNGPALRMDAERLVDQIASINDRLEALSGQLGSPEAPGSVVRELLNRLPGTSSSSTAWGTVASSEVHASLAKELAELRTEQATADRRIQLRLGEIQDILRKLSAQFASVACELANIVDEQTQLSARSTSPSEPPASVFRGVEELSARDSAGYGSVKRAFKAAMPTNEEESSLSKSTGDEVLLEPGTGAPQRPREAGELAQAIGSKTNPSVSAHIAAARRAARAALSEGGVENALTASPPAGRRVEGAKLLYVNHKRTVLLAVALAIAVGVAVRLIGTHEPFVQKSESVRQPVKAAATGISPAKPADLASAITPIARPVDTTPTASIVRSFEPEKANTKNGAPPPELLATVPAGLSPFLRDAVIAGSPGAEYELAQRLFEGRGLPQDQQAAALWFERAASSGLAPAQFRIGTLYQKGVGVARDAAAAKRWYEKAAEAGNARAAHNLAVMYAEPLGDQPDYTEATKWFRKAAELGVRDSQFNLAILYARGLGVDQDFRQSWLWFTLAAAQGDADAGKKRDEVAAKMDPAALAAATEELIKFKVAQPDPVANEVATPPGGWDGKPGASPLSQTLPESIGGARPLSAP